MSSDDRSDALLTAMGESIRVRRLELGLTLKDVQASTGLTHPFLSKIERGLSRPSMRTLTSIADVLGTTAYGLMALDASDESWDVKAGESLEVAHGESVARALIRGKWPFLPVEYLSGPSEFEEFYVHSTREMIYVAHGECEMEIEGHGLFTLGAGESLFYGAQVRHRWRRLSPGPIRVLLVQENDAAGGGASGLASPIRGGSTSSHVPNPGRTRGSSAQISSSDPEKS